MLLQKNIVDCSMLPPRKKNSSSTLEELKLSSGQIPETTLHYVKDCTMKEKKVPINSSLSGGKSGGEKGPSSSIHIRSRVWETSNGRGGSRNLSRRGSVQMQ